MLVVKTEQTGRRGKYCHGQLEHRSVDLGLEEIHRTITTCKLPLITLSMSCTIRHTVNHRLSSTTNPSLPVNHFEREMHRQRFLLFHLHKLSITACESLPIHHYLSIISSVSCIIRDFSSSTSTNCCLMFRGIDSTRTLFRVA